MDASPTAHTAQCAAVEVTERRTPSQWWEVTCADRSLGGVVPDGDGGYVAIRGDRVIAHVHELPDAAGELVHAAEVAALIDGSDQALDRAAAVRAAGTVWDRLTTPIEDAHAAALAEDATGTRQAYAHQESANCTPR